MSDAQTLPAKTTKAADEAPPIQPFNEKFLKVREFAAKDFNFTVPSGTGPEELLNPARWAHMAGRFRTGTYLHIDTEDGTWAAVFRVYVAGDSWAKVHLCWLSEILAQGDSDPTPPEFRYKIDHIGSGWRIIHKETGKVVKGGMQTRTEAEDFMKKEIVKSTR